MLYLKRYKKSNIFLSVVNFNICYNFWTVRGKRLYIWHAYSTNDAISNDTKVNDLVTLSLTFMLKKSSLGLCCHRGIVFVSPANCLSCSHPFLEVTHSYVSQATHAFPGIPGNAATMFHKYIFFCLISNSSRFPWRILSVFRVFPLFQLLGFILSCVNIYMYSDEDESCKYFAQTSTYNRPSGLYNQPSDNTYNRPSTAHTRLSGFMSDISTSSTPTKELYKYQPIRNRDSWCLPTYISYDGSCDWSNSVSHGASVEAGDVERGMNTGV